MIPGLTDNRRLTKLVRPRGDISRGRELRRMLRSVKRMARRVDDRAGAARNPFEYLTSLIFLIG